MLIELARRRNRSSFRRTVLGPLWYSAEQLLFTSGFALLSAGLFNRSFSEAVVHVGSGMMIFTLVADVSLGMTGVVRNLQVMKSSPLPFSSAFLITLFEKFQLAAFRFLGLSVLFVWNFRFSVGTIEKLGPQAVAFLALLVFSFGCAFFVGGLSVRYRDLEPIFGVVSRLAFFVTPIFWSFDDIRLGASAARSGLLSVQRFNVFAWFVVGIRDGAAASYFPFGSVFGLLFLGLVVAAVGIVTYLISFDNIRRWV